MKAMRSTIPESTLPHQTQLSLQDIARRLNAKYDVRCVHIGVGDNHGLVVNLGGMLIEGVGGLGGELAVLEVRVKRADAVGASEFLIESEIASTSHLTGMPRGRPWFPGVALP